MPIIEGSGLGAPIQSAGAPVSGTDPICTLTLANCTGGTFKLKVTSEDAVSEVTGNISWSATNNTLISNVDAALEALTMATGSADFTTADATLSSGLGTLTITMVALFAKTVSTIEVYSDSTTGTGHSVTAEMTTPGVRGSFRGASKGALVSDTTNGVLYINTGTADKPVWTKVGTQS
jgi:hypothetical protein